MVVANGVFKVNWGLVENIIVEKTGFAYTKKMKRLSVMKYVAN